MIKIPNKRELYLIALNHFFDIEFEKFMKIDKYFTKEPHLTIRKTSAIWRIENFSLGSELKNELTFQGNNMPDWRRFLKKEDDQDLLIDKKI